MTVRKGWIAAIVLLSSLGFAWGDTSHVAADTMIDLIDVEASYGTAPGLVVTNIESRKEGQRYVRARFDLTGLPSRDRIDGAYLRIWVDQVSSAGFVGLHRVWDPWDESSVTAETLPFIERFPFATIEIATVDQGRFRAFDVTGAVID